VLPIDRVYVLHYVCATRRRRFQEEQLPLLGRPVTWVEGCDRRQLLHSVKDEHHCSSAGAGEVVHTGATPFLPPVLKLYAALLDVANRGLQVALVLEDDARFSTASMDTVASALRRLQMSARYLGNWTMLSLGAYNAAGTDNGLPPGLHPSYATTPGARPGGSLPAIAQAISKAGAWHILAHAFPIRANIDLALSHEALPTASPGRTWYLKGLPGVHNWSYAVTPAGSTLGAERSTTSSTTTSTNAPSCVAHSM
jgi:hypothetical protein